MSDPQIGNVPLPISRGLPRPPAPPPLIERLRNEVTDASRVGNSNIFYYFGQSHLIGRGGSSMVFKGYHQVPEKATAVKLVRCDESDTNELEIWNKLHSNEHPGLNYIVSLYEYAVDKNILYISMEMASRNLEQELLYHTRSPSDYPIHFSFLRNIAAGLEYLHINNIVHRDIKPQNIFIFENPQTGEKVAKLGDFGLSRCLSQTEGSISNGQGTEMWMSPETLRAFHDDELFMNTKSMDIFSFGLVAAYTLCERRHPFSQNEKLLVNIKNPELGPRLYNIHNEEKYAAAEHLILWMLQKHPGRRPTIQQCRAHPFLWENQEEKWLEYFKDLMEAINQSEEDEDGNDHWKEYQNITGGIDESVTKHYMLRKRRSNVIYERTVSWNWEHVVDPILLERRSTATTTAKYNGYSVWSLMKFAIDKLKNPQSFTEGAVQKLFSLDGTDENFSREKFAKYFMNLFPEMLPLVYFTVTRISTKFARLNRLKEKYFKEMVDCHENWNIGILTDCMERLNKKLKL